MARSTLLLKLLGLALAAGCASAGSSQVASTQKNPSKDEVPACERYSKQLCGALGEKTEACLALRSVREWLPEKACVAALAEIDGSLAKVGELRKDCEALTTRLCSALGEQSVTCEEVKRDLPEVPPGQCRTLLEHYPELLAQLQEREARTQPLGEEPWRALAAGNAPSFGPENAKVTIVEFSDFQCPYCAQASETVKRIRDKYGDKVRFVFRQFPLPFHQNARGAAEAALAAHAQGKFWQYHDRLFAHQGSLDRKSLEGYAQELGLDLPSFRKGLDDRSFDTQVEGDIALGRTAKVDGTPTMFINQRRAPNPTDFDAVAPLIEAALTP
ncbi:MAG: thioredoxin domain-containing protein [Polyangiales bacterium]